MADPPNEEVIQFYQSLKKAPEEIDASGVIFGEKLREGITLASPDNVAQMKVALVDVLLTLHRIKSERLATTLEKSRATQPQNALA